MGMKVYINPKTSETVAIPNVDLSMYDETELWEQDLERIENEWEDSVVMTDMESYEAYKIMEAFVEELEEGRLKEDLTKILNRKSPFANFKDEINMSDKREDWFDFKQKKKEQYVMNILEANDIQFERVD